MNYVHHLPDSQVTRFAKLPLEFFGRNGFLGSSDKVESNVPFTERQLGGLHNRTSTKHYPVTAFLAFPLFTITFPPEMINAMATTFRAGQSLLLPKLPPVLSASLLIWKFLKILPVTVHTGESEAGSFDNQFQSFQIFSTHSAPIKEEPPD